LRLADSKELLRAAGLCALGLLAVELLLAAFVGPLSLPGRLLVSLVEALLASLIAGTVLVPDAGAPLPASPSISDAAESPERSESGEEQRVAQRRAESIIEASPDLVGYADAEGFAVYLNPAGCRLLGYDKSELSGVRIVSFHDDESAQRILSEALPLAASGSAWSGETLFRDKAGQLTPVWQVLVGFHDESGAVVGYSTIARDISSRVASERALRESEEKYRRLVELAQEGIWAIDAESLTSFVNPSMARMLGYEIEEMMGRSLFDFMDEEGRRICETNLERRRLGVREEHDFELRRKDGQRLIVLMATAPIDGPEGYLGAIAGVIDVTEQRSNAERLHRSEKLEAIGSLAGGIAHDFNNMLLAISGNLELLGLGLEPEAQVRRYLRSALEATNRASDMTRRILAFSHQKSCVKSPQSFESHVEEAIGLLRRLVGENIEMEISLQAPGAHVEAAPSQLVQLPLNLVINARDAMPKGGSLQIVTRLSADHACEGEECVVLVVSDDGIGMSAETKRHAFDPFFTTKEVGKGTGLGLATVQAIVHDLGGRLELTSSAGEGTRVEVHLPTVPAPQAEPEPSAELGEPSPSGITVLVVEDEPSVRELVLELVESCGYQAIAAADGAEALAKLECLDTPIDLLFTDLLMPGMSGRELAKRVRERCPEVRTLLTSGYDQHGAESERREAFLQKPYRPNELRAALRKLVSGGWD